MTVRESSIVGTGAPITTTTPVLAISKISKTFAGVRVLSDVELSVLPGEVHGLVGQNGSGKSTLIKIVAGYHTPDPGGVILLNGTRLQLPLAPGAFRAFGMSFVHQNLGLADSLSVLDNMRLGRYDAKLVGRIRRRREEARVSHILNQFNLAVDPYSLVGELSDAERAGVAIARAFDELSENSKGTSHRGILVLDEPTPYLSKDAVDALFAAVHRVVAEGAACVFVSHRLSEVRDFTHRATILRDGEVVGTYDSHAMTDRELIPLIIGKQLPTKQRVGTTPMSQQVLSVRGLTGGRVENLSFALHRNEILGVTGLIGAGFEDLPYLLIGARTASSGVANLYGNRIDLPALSPTVARKLGITLVPAHRERDGAVLSLTLGENISLPQIGNFYRHGRMHRRDERRTTEAIARSFEVNPSDTTLIFGTLSGGNQQKAVMGKWLSVQPMVLLLHEPTQGVDVAARQQILAQVRQTAREGAGVVIASVEYEELAGFCDRIIVMDAGKSVVELTGSGLTKESILEAVYRGTD